MLYKFRKFTKSCIKIVFLIFIVFGCHKISIEELDVVNISNTPGRSENPAIAADSRGYFYVVWNDQFVTGESLVIYMVSRPPGGEWSTPVKIFEPQAAKNPDIEVDNSNTVHVVWQNTNNEGWGEILYSQKPLSGNWTEPETISIYGTSTVPDLVLSNNGDIHVVWQELVGYWPIFYIKKTQGGSWTTPVEISTGNIFYTSDLKITTDPQSNAHVVWRETKTGAGPAAIVYTTNAPDGTWSDPLDIAVDPYSTIGGPSIACDNSGTIHLVWHQNADIFYTSKPLNNQWKTAVRLCSTSTLSMWPRLAVDSDGSLHLVWEENGNKIYYISKFEESDWAEPEIYIINTVVGFFGVKMAISPNTIGLVFNGYILPLTGEDNYEVFFDEITKN